MRHIYSVSLSHFFIAFFCEKSRESLDLDSLLCQPTEDVEMLKC